MRPTRLITSLAAAGAVVVLAAACTSGADEHAGDDPTTSTQAPGAVASGSPSASTSSNSAANAAPGEVEAENVIATCMKRQGFTYVPRPELNDSADEERKRQYTGPASLLLSDSDLRTFRQKYGFGNQNAPLAYPDDPLVADPPSPPNPNTAIAAALDPARRRAYNLALSGNPAGDEKRALRNVNSAGYKASCRSKGQQIRDRVSARLQKEYDAKKRDYDRVIARFANDSEVQRVAKKYIGCLARKGLKPESYSLTYIGNAGPDGYIEAHPMPETPTASSARAQLPAEITGALDDLTCRTALAELVRTKFPDEPAAALGGGGDGVG